MVFQQWLLLKERGLKRFDPYRFDPVMVEKVMNLLRTSTNPTTDAVVETWIRKSMAAPAADQAPRSFWPIAAALIVVVVVVVVVVAAGIFFLT